MINVKDIIQQGELAKYQIIIEHEGFSMTEDEFAVTLLWGMRGESLVVPKSEMLQNEGGDTFLTFPTKDMVGQVDAECEYFVPDTDAPDGVRREVERQPICFVNTSVRLPQFTQPGIYDGTHVSYIRRTQVGLRTLYRVLRDVTGAWLRDANGLVLRALRRN